MTHRVLATALLAVAALALPVAPASASPGFEQNFVCANLGVRCTPPNCKPVGDFNICY